MMKPIPYEPTELHVWKFVPMSELVRTHSMSVTESSVASASESLPPPSDVGNEQSIPPSSGSPAVPSGEPQSQPSTLEVTEQYYSEEGEREVVPPSVPSAPTVGEQ